MKTTFRLILFATLAALLFTNCSDDNASSTSPELGALGISPDKLYTGQKATVSVTFSSTGEHVYFASSAFFTCTVSGNGYNRTDTIPVFKTEDLRIPHDFSFQTILPLTSGTYQLTFRTPSINKSSTSQEGEPLYFPPLTKQINIRVIQADAINANFGDSREMVANYLNVSDSTITDAGFDPTAKTSGKAIADNFILETIYKFKNNALTQVDNPFVYPLTGIIYDDQGQIVDVTVNTDDAETIKRKVKQLMLLESPWSLISAESNEYVPTTAKETYPNMADEDNVNRWQNFLKDVMKGAVKSYQYKYQHNTTSTKLTITLSALGESIQINNKYEK